MEPKFARAEDARKAGWFSRRHKTDAAHVATREARAARHAGKLEMARERGGSPARRPALVA
jgi:hypothetical protein